MSTGSVLRRAYGAIHSRSLTAVDESSRSIRCGVVAPFFDAAETADAAALAEQHGWDGIFLAEAVWGVDAWIALTAAALKTQRIRLGTMLTPIARMKPWDLASKVATLDRLSNGRVQLSVGLGALHPGWTAFERATPRHQRVELLEEGLAVYDGLMRGQPFSFEGRHYRVEPTDFFPPDPPVQKPRVPVWVVGASPSRRSLLRAARWDGLIPNIVTDGGARGPASPEELRGIVDEIMSMGGEMRDAHSRFDVIAEGTTPAVDHGAAVKQVDQWRDGGATWWIESDWTVGLDDSGRAKLHARIEAGPPR